MADKKERTPRYIIVDMPTQTKPVFKDTEEKNPDLQYLELYDLVAKIANDVEEIRKGLSS